MNTMTSRIRLAVTAATMLSGYAAMLLSVPALADDTATIAHRAIRAKILNDAHDRYAVRFLSTHVDKVQRGYREVTGEGVFRRRGKNGQNFSYHTLVRPSTGENRATNYRVR